MTGKTHLACGVATGLALAMIKDAPFNIGATITICSSVGALFPDIDKMNSKMGRKALPISAAAQLICGHRGMFHSPCLYLLLGALSLLFFPEYVLYITAVLLGILSHLFLDMLNPTGIPLLYPITKKKFNLLSINTGGIGEKLFFIGFVVLAFYFFGSDFLEYLHSGAPDIPGFIKNIGLINIFTV